MFHHFGFYFVRHEGSRRIRGSLDKSHQINYELSVCASLSSAIKCFLRTTFSN